MISGSRGTPLLVAWLSLMVSVGANAADAPTSDGAKSSTGSDTYANKDTARSMAREALALMHEQRWGEAHSLLSRAYAMVPAPTIALLDGRALDHLGRLVEASERYEAAARTTLEDDAPAAFREAVRDAQAALEKLRKRIPSLTVTLTGGPGEADGVRVSVDQHALAEGDLDRARRVDPGDHVVRVVLDGRLALEDTVLLKEGETKRIVMNLMLASSTPPPENADSARASRPRPRTITAWTAIGLGVAGLGTGITGGVIMLNAHENLEAVCHPTCPSSAADDLSRFRTARTISSVGYVTGGVGLVTGAAMLLFGKRPSDNTRTPGVSAWSSGRSVGVRGTF